MKNISKIFILSLALAVVSAQAYKTEQNGVKLHLGKSTHESSENSHLLYKYFLDYQDVIQMDLQVVNTTDKPVSVVLAPSFAALSPDALDKQTKWNVKKDIADAFLPGNTPTVLQHGFIKAILAKLGFIASYIPPMIFMGIGSGLYKSRVIPVKIIGGFIAAPSFIAMFVFPYIAYHKIMRSFDKKRINKFAKKMLDESPITLMPGEGLNKLVFVTKSEYKNLRTLENPFEMVVSKVKLK